MKRIEERIKNAVENADSSDALFNVLKTKVNTYEQKLKNSFSNLDVIDSKEKLEKYLEIQDVLFECAVLLENTKPKSEKESQVVSSNTKIQASKKMPKLQLLHFYGDMENWISFKELFHAMLNNFWSIEKIPPNVSVEKRNDPCEQLYQQSVRRNDEGRFIVSLPFKEEKTLGEIKERAIHLFFALENRLNRKPPLKEKFNTFMNEYLSLGHMKAISIDREKESLNCYIPYHMIQNDNSSTNDLLAGADTEEEAKAITAEIQNLMKSGGFSLRKWSSSHKIILKDLDKFFLATESIYSLCDEKVKQRVLGIFWNLLTDSIQVIIADGEIVNTKRQLLSVIAKIFDRLGLFSHSVIILKIMLQELWESKATWDDPASLTIL
ncbi:hypothetical protein HNY73_006439 [Argiope bruennichi]|uniref:Uncharacterized protein n=1 Tax=Argiope bruennichi TaxID=94029 RepID=A0A8T0FK23_ARGBR|nr:hypothetical protein HNY73_006439 [Argiope bruennichi]